MEWLKINIDTTSQGMEVVSNIFYNCGIFGLEITDSKEFLEILEQTRIQWDFVEDDLYEEYEKKRKVNSSCVTAYVANDSKSGDICKLIKTEVEKLKSTDTKQIFGTLQFSVKSLNEEDWAENWKKYFKPLPIGKRVLVNPVWENVPDEHKDRTVFMVDPGMSFGTGSHETTKLCVEAIQKYIHKDDSVLDLGCGSGILFIISLLLGAKKAKAVDIDENSTVIARKNAELNNINSNIYSVLLGDITKDEKLFNDIAKENYNLILANIVADVIIPILPLVKKVMTEKSVFIASGIINTSAEKVIEAIKQNGFTIKEILQENDWVAVVSSDNTAEI